MVFSRNGLALFVGSIALFGVGLANVSVRAATSTWTGGGTTTAGTLNTGNPTQVAVNYLTWDTVDAANWGGVTPYTAGDIAVFNVASGTFVIRPSANTLDPAS